MSNKRKIFQVLRGIKEQLPTLNSGEFGLCIDENLYIGTPNGNKKIAYYSDIEDAINNYISVAINSEY